MKTKKSFLICLKILSIILFFNIQKGRADEAGNSSVMKSWRLSLGYGVAIKNNIRKNNNYSKGRADVIFNHIPIVQIAWGPLSIGAQGITANALGNRDTAFFLNLNRNGDRYYATGMDARRDSWFFGAGIKYYKINVLLARDIEGKSHGIKGSINYTSLYPIGEKIFTRSSAGLECYNRAHAEYYYGVKSYEATTTRPEYHPGAYCLPTASFFPSYKAHENINLLMGISSKILASEIRSSPTTNGAWLEAALILGATWKF